VLELLKQRRILAEQAALFGPIIIERGTKFEQTA
jgi:chromatin segregation and condensation protein Rec8/ScpA/Scc1 (kleisin family)